MIRRVGRIAIAVTSLSLMASACAGPEQAVPVSVRHPISVEQDQASMTLTVNNRTSKLSHADRGALRGFFSDYQRRGHGPIFIEASTASPTQRVVHEIVDFADNAGISNGQIVQRALGASDNYDTIVLSFKKYTASVQKCGDWSRDLAKSWKNERSPNFGCAYQNNLAAMLVDPHDLIAPRGMDPADPMRRSTVLESYRAGDVTGAERAEEESGQVSEIE